MKVLMFRYIIFGIFILVACKPNNPKSDTVSNTSNNDTATQITTEEFLKDFSSDQKELFNTYKDEKGDSLGEIIVSENITGQLYAFCQPPRSRPWDCIWRTFKDVTIIKDGNDWTIFGQAKPNVGSAYESIVIDVLESSNTFQIKIGNYYPWKANLNDESAVSYRISGNKIIIRAIRVVSSQAKYCNISGTIAVVSSDLKLTN